MRLRDPAMTTRMHVALAVVVLGLISLACKHTYTPPGSADASADVREEPSPEPTGSCAPDVGNYRCDVGGKASFCKSRVVHDGPRSTHWEGDWTTFACPDCSKTGVNGHIKCASYAAGDPCDTLVADEMCASKYGAYRCDHATNKWTVEPCPGGCDQTYQLVCKH
jgi:hypothetical protein